MKTVNSMSVIEKMESWGSLILKVFKRLAFLGLLIPKFLKKRQP
jgi:hypothetical protein